MRSLTLLEDYGKILKEAIGYLEDGKSTERIFITIDGLKCLSAELKLLHNKGI